MASPVLCKECGQAIQHRRDLYVLGRNLAPVHGACQPAFNRKQPWYLKSWALNRWPSLIAFNALLLVMSVGLLAMRPWVSLQGLAPIFVAVNLWLLVGKAICYSSMERYLPN